MKKIEKPDHINNNEFEYPDDDLAFLLWSAEFNKELLAFWKSIVK
jgi:hypothetical protein